MTLAWAACQSPTSPAGPASDIADVWTVDVGDQDATAEDVAATADVEPQDTGRVVDAGADSAIADAGPDDDATPTDAGPTSDAQPGAETLEDAWVSDAGTIDDSVSMSDAGDVDLGDTGALDSEPPVDGGPASEVLPLDSAGSDAGGPGGADAQDAAPADAGPADCCPADGSCLSPDLVCVAGKVCVPAPLAGQCWQDADCPPGQGCSGASVCPCGADCPQSAIGSCSAPPAPGCCADQGGCKGPWVCAEAQAVCKDPTGLKPNQCWTDGQCPADQHCVGANICPCGAMCLVADQPGNCAPPEPPPPPGCCPNGACSSGSVCVSGTDVCKDLAQLGPGQCWTDGQCPAGTCQGANVCPCGAACFAPDAPGKCDPPAATCQKVDPTGFGLCEMIIGWVYDGKTCVLASGCGCGKLCGAVFASQPACQLACGVGPPG